MCKPENLDISITTTLLGKSASCIESQTVGVMFSFSFPHTEVFLKLTPKPRP